MPSSQSSHQNRTRRATQGRTMMGNWPSTNGVLGPSRSSSLRPNRPRSSFPRSTPPSLPTRATYAHPSACLTTPSQCLPTPRLPSCHRCAGAQGSTSPPSCPPSPPATKPCNHRPLHPSQTRAACCIPVSVIMEPSGVFLYPCLSLSLLFTQSLVCLVLQSCLSL